MIDADGEDWDGRCFAWVLKHAKSGDVVAHGTITSPLTGSSFGHAWIERRGRTYDNTGGSMPLAAFKKTFHPRDVDRYADHEALVYAIRTRHAGPWTPEERGPVPRTPKRRR